MASNTNLGGVFTTDIDGQLRNPVFLSTENVVGMIFDTAIAGGMDGASLPDAFKDGNVVELNTKDDCKDAGLTKEVMGGLPYYHIVETFFTLAGQNQRLFVSFMDSTTDTDFEAIEKMQLASGGILYQIGLWTSKPFAKTGAGEKYIVDDSCFLLKLQEQAELLGGKVGVTNYEGNSPLNIIVNAPVLGSAACDYKKLPDLTTLNLPKVSVVLGQAATDKVHGIMKAVNELVEGDTFVPVGNIGMVMAVLALAPADENIGHVENFNLAQVALEAELGFGNIAFATEGKGEAEVATVGSATNIKTIGYQKRNMYLHKNGFIFLMNHDGYENGIFFSGDQTLSNGDYRSISRCRVMHKSRRVVRRALLPRVNSTVEVDVTTGTLSSSTVAEFQNLVLEALRANMVQPGTQVPQISGCTCTINEEQDVLSTDKIDIDYRLISKGNAGEINVTEGFAATEG